MIELCQHPNHANPAIVIPCPNCGEDWKYRQVSPQELQELLINFRKKAMVDCVIADCYDCSSETGFPLCEGPEGICHVEREKPHRHVACGAEGTWSLMAGEFGLDEVKRLSPRGWVDE